METKPPVTGTTHALPFDKLDPMEFERLCLWLVGREGYNRGEHLGAAGSEQGRDVLAWKDGERWAFQCKRYKTFNAADAFKEIEKVAGLPADQRPIGLVFVVTCNVRAKARQQARIRCQEEQLVCEFWAGTELDEKVKRHPDIVAEFFQIPEVLGTGGKIAAPLVRHDFYLLSRNDLPPNYIPRPELLDDVRMRLLPSADGVALTSAIQPKTAVVLHGMGGTGKSVLARALCDDPAVQTAFPDGILWVTLGQKPELNARLREWVEALGGTVSQTAPTLDQLRNTLAEALKNKACLLIIDDAWQKSHLEPFAAGGSACRLLITTRDAAITENLKAEVHRVPVMTSDQAIALLEAWADGKLAHVKAALKAKIIKRLGKLPLAIRLAGAQLREDDPDEWLAQFNALQLEARRVEKEDDSLAWTFNLSLDALKKTDSRRHGLYIALSIFKANEATPVATIVKLWSALDQRDVRATTRLVADMSDRALLVRSRDDGSITIHNLLRDFMVDELGAEGREQCHRALLAAYRDTWTGEGWHTASDDGYLYNHLAYHLDALADYDEDAMAELAGLFANDRWLHARVARSDYLYDGYVSDLMLTWRRAHAQVTQGSSSALADCVRYALIRTSINSLSGSYEPALVARAVDTGLRSWSASRALSTALRVPDAQKRCEFITRLLDTSQFNGQSNIELRKKGEEEALTAVRDIHDEFYRASALETLAPRLSGDLLQEALTVARSIQSESYRARALAALIPQLNSDSLKEGLSAVLKIQDASYRARALAPLIPQVSGDLLQEALSAARNIQDESSQADALADLAAQLSGDLLQEGFSAALKIHDASCRARALTSLAPQFNGDDKERILQEALSAAHSIQDEQVQVKALVTLVPQLSSDLLQAGLSAARNIQDMYYRARALASLAPRLSGDNKKGILQEALTAARNIHNEYYLVHALAALAPQLSGDLAQEGLTIARNMHNEYYLVYALAALAPQLSGDDRERILQEALTAAHNIRSESSRARALVDLAPHLAGNNKERALQAGLSAARNIQDERFQAKALAALAPHLSGDLLQAGLAAAPNIQSEYARAEVLTALAPQLSGNLLQEGLTVARNIQDESYRARALTSLAPHLSGDLLQAGLTAACNIQSEYARAEVLTALAPQLSCDLAQEALVAVLKIQSESVRANVLVALVPQLSGGEKDRVLQEGLFSALQIQSESSRADALAALAPYFSGDLLQAALAAARNIKDEYYQADALAALAAHFSGDNKECALQAGLAAARNIKDEFLRARVLASLALQFSGDDRVRALQEGLAAIRNIQNETYRANRAKAMATLAPQLSGDLLQEAFAAARNIQNEFYRAGALAVLAPRLSGDLLQEALAAARNIQSERDQAEVLAALASRLGGDLLQEALAAVVNIQDEQDQARALAALAPQLSDDLLQEALAAARNIQSGHSRASVLAALAPQLDDDLIQEALAAACSIQSESARADALAALAPQFSDNDKERVLQEALATAVNVQSESARADTLSTLAPQLSGDLLQEALAATRNIQNERSRARALASLAPQLCGNLLQEALTAARNIQDEHSRAKALASLVPHNLLQESLAAAYNIQGSSAAVVHQLSKNDKERSQQEELSALRKTQDDARNLQDELYRAAALASLSAYFSRDDKERALQEALTAARNIQNAYYRANTLAPFVALSPNDTTIVTEIRMDVVNVLFAQFQNEPRADLLSFFSNDTIFQADIFPTNMLASITMQIMKICGEWEWP